MASVSLKLVLLASVFVLLGHTSAQELYEDEGNLEQYSPLLGEALIDYPILEEYGIPTVEEFPAEDEDDDDEDDVNEDGHSSETEQKAKKGQIKHQDYEHAQKTSSELKLKSDAREKRQLPLQDDPVVIAREKLQRAIKAAKALSNIENQLGLNPSTVEHKTEKLEKQLKDEEKNFKQLADQAENKDKKQKFVKLEKVADEDVNEAQSILKLIVKLEAAKYLAKERAQEELDTAQKNKIASAPQMVLGQPFTYPPQTAGYFGGVPQPAYRPMMPAYMANYPLQMFQGMGSPSVGPAPSILSPASLVGPTNTAPPYQPSYQGNTELQTINAINAPQTGAPAFPPKSSPQHSVQSVQSEADKTASYSPEEDNADISPGDMEFSDMESPPPAKKPTVTQVKAQFNAHDSSSSVAKTPQAHIKPQPPSKDAGLTINHPAQPARPAQPDASAQPVAPVQQVAAVQPVAPPQLLTPVQPIASVQSVMPEQPVAPAQPVSPVQTIESAVGQSNGFMPQSAPLSASYNPVAVAPNLASMSRYFDSPSNSPNLMASQPYYEPPKPQATQQTSAPHTEPMKPGLKSPAPEKPEGSPDSDFNDQSQVSAPPSPPNVQPPAAYSGEQALSGSYPTSPFYPWNSQLLPSGNPQYSWSSPMYYSPAAPYQAPVNPLIAEAYRKLHDTERASLAMSKIEEAIGLSPNSVKHIISDIENQAKMDANRYEDDMSKEKAEITKEKESLEKDQVADEDQARKKIQNDEQKLRNDIKKENVAKLEVDKIKKIEKILTIIEAAKYSAMQRAKKRIHKLKADEGVADGDDIRKRDLEDLENDIRRRRRNEINIWLKGSRNRIDTSHFLRNRIGSLGRRHEEDRPRWSLDQKTLLHHSEASDKINKTDDDPRESKLHKLKFFKTLSSRKSLNSGNELPMAKRTDVPRKPENSANAFIMAKMLDKMDKLFKIQADILKYLKTEHSIKRLQKKPFTKRWKRSLHNSKHHKNTHKDIKRKKRNAN